MGKLERSMSGPGMTGAAYATIAMHALKSPDCAICGVLVGTPGNIQRAFPLHHGQITLSPMMGIAFAQVDAMLEEECPGLQVVGYYQGNSHHDDTRVGDSGFRVANKIRSFCAEACVLVLKNAGLEGLKEGNASGLFEVHQYDSSKKDWKQLPKESVVTPENVAAKVISAYRNKSHQRLVDFDDHLQTPDLDWMHNDESVVMECVV